MNTFISIVAPKTEVLNGKTFECNEQAIQPLRKSSNDSQVTPILALLSFSKIVKVECDAFGVGIGAIFS